MSRRVRNADGTINLLSFSYFGSGDGNEELQRQLIDIDAHNRKARAVWDSLIPREREKRIEDFEAQEKMWNEQMKQRLAELEMLGEDSMKPDESSKVVLTFI
jgi:hypothetical protein